MKEKQQERARLELKHKVMIERIDKLCDMYSLLNDVSTKGDGPVLVDSFKKFPKHFKTLSIIKGQYNRMYDAIMQTGEFEKYNEVEDTIISKIAEIEINLDAIIHKTSTTYKEMITGAIENIKESENCKSYTNIEEELHKIKILKELSKLYNPYITTSEMQALEKQISTLKFEVLIKKQVEELIYKNGGKTSSLTKYDNEKEKNLFLELLREKMDRLTALQKDEVLKMKPKDILKDCKALERLLMIDMANNPLDYIGVVKANIFNPHLFHLKNNPFKAEGYFIEEHKSWDNPMAYHGGPMPKNFMSISGPWYFDVILKAEKVNFSLLTALLKSVITDENIGIVECDNLYKRFGFDCTPMRFPISLGQKCVQMVWEKVNGSEEYNEILKSLKDNKQAMQSNRGTYCGIEFRCLSFESYGQTFGNLLNQMLSERKIEGKGRSFFSESISTEMADDIQFEKMKVSQTGSISSDINVLILQLEDVIVKFEKNIQRNKETIEGYKGMDDYDKELMKRAKEGIERLKQFKALDRQLTKEEANLLIETIQFTSNELYSYGNWTWAWRQWSPLEKLGKREEIPESGIDPLWEKYESECKDLGIDVKKGETNEERSRELMVYVNLDDISDLPIDYDKIEIVYAEEIDSINEEKEQEDEER